MTYHEVRGLYMRNEQRMLAIFGCRRAQPDQEFFSEVWRGLSYYDRLKTAQRLNRPGVHCSCLPTCHAL